MKKGIPISILSKDSTSDIVSGEIRNLILSGKILPGKRISSERALAKFLGVTRNAVRNGLLRLEEEGLVKPKGKGRVVTTNPPLSDGLSAKTIAILMDEALPVQDYLNISDSGWSTAISGGAVSEAFKDKMTMIIIPAGESDRMRLERILDIQLGGLVIISNMSELSCRDKILKSIKNRRLPIVTYGDIIEMEGCDAVYSDHRQGCRELAMWLISAGARKILRICDKMTGNPAWFSQRNEGFMEACRDAGIKTLPILEIPVAPSYDFSKASFEAEVHKIAGYLFKRLEGDGKIDAIMGASDGFVPKVAAALKVLGRDPAKMLITGYDNYWEKSPDRQWESMPPAATVDKNNMKIGQELVRMMRRRLISELDDSPEKIIVSQRLIILNR